MRIRMLTEISGGRADGTPWPPAGGELDVPDAEGMELCTAGVALPVDTREAGVETPEGPAQQRSEQRAARGTGRPRGAQGRAPGA